MGADSWILITYIVYFCLEVQAKERVLACMLLDELESWIGAKPNFGDYDPLHFFWNGEKPVRPNKMVKI